MPHFHWKWNSSSSSWHPRSTTVWPASTISFPPTTLLHHLVPARGAVKNLNHKKEVTVSYLHTFPGASCCLECISISPSSRQTPLTLLTVLAWPTPIISHYRFQVSPPLLEVFTDAQKKLTNSPLYTPPRGYLVHCQSSCMPWGLLSILPGELQEYGEGVWHSFAYPVFSRCWQISNSQ